MYIYIINNILSIYSNIYLEYRIKFFSLIKITKKYNVSKNDNIYYLLTFSKSFK